MSTETTNDTVIADDLRARRAKFGTLAITTRHRSDTYIARAAGVHGRSASCTMGPLEAALQLARKIFGVPDYFFDVRAAAATVYYIDLADPDGLTAAEIKGLSVLIESLDGMGSVTSPLLARTLRNLCMRRPGLVTLCDVPPDSAGTKPYFGAVVTAAGRTAYAAAKEKA
jgi:hypothetical protein